MKKFRQPYVHSSGLDWQLVDDDMHSLWQLCGDQKKQLDNTRQRRFHKCQRGYDGA